MSGRFVDAGGTQIYVRERGQGAPVVLLHGFPETGDAWNGVADRLAGRHRVFIPDLPGFGQSEPPRAFDAGTVAKTILAAMEEAGAPKFALVGHDWGGSIAFRLALDAPERVEKLVIVNAPFRHLDFVRGFHMLAFNVPLVPEIAMVLAGRTIVPWMIRAAAANKGAFDAETVRPYQEAFSDLRHARSTLAYYRTITRDIVRKRVFGALPVPGKPRKARGPRRDVEAPTLIVWGMRDPVMPPSLVETITRDVPHATVVEIPDAGHFVPEEAPEQLAHEIDRFLLAP